MCQRCDRVRTPVRQLHGLLDGRRRVVQRDGRALLSALDSLPRGSVAVVSGHSNTVPALVAALAPGARVVRDDPESLKIDNATYDRLFVVTQWAPGKGASVLELRF